MIKSLSTNLLWTQGRNIVLVLVLITGIAVVCFPWLLVALLAVWLFVLYFFRNPVRACHESVDRNTVFIAPSDGRVVSVATGEDGTKTVSVFLSIFDVHVNWIPIDGVIESITYVPGKFLPAYRPKCSDENEHNVVVIRTRHGQIVQVRQIAGRIARRIVWWVKSGQTVYSGEKYGMIRFGSRVEITMEASVVLMVEVGQRVVGGQTVIARLGENS